MSARFARPYADAMLATAPAAFDYARMLDGLSAVGLAMAENRSLQAVLASPSVAAPVKQAIVAALGAKAGLDEVGTRFVSLILKNGRILHLSEMIAALREALDAREGVVPATVTVARPIPESSQKKVIEALSLAVGRKVRARFEIDPAILAGLVARVGSRVYDASALRAIERFKEEAYADQSR